MCVCGVSEDCCFVLCSLLGEWYLCCLTKYVTVIFLCSQDRETLANAMFTSPADIFRFFCKPHISKESEEEPQLEASESIERSTPKSVRWDPNLVSYSNEGGETQQLETQGMDTTPQRRRSPISVVSSNIPMQSSAGKGV